jgi:hypothetical protein
MEDLKWKQMAKRNWYRQGDRNTNSSMLRLYKGGERTLLAEFVTKKVGAGLRLLRLKKLSSSIIRAFLLQ